MYSFPAIQESGARFPIGRVSEDMTFNLRILSCVRKIAFYPKTTLLCLKRQDSITTTFQPDYDQDIWYIDTQALAFLERTGWDNAVGQEKADALLCRNVVVYLFSIMSKRNKMPYIKKIRKAKELITHPNARGVIRKKHKIPYFESKKAEKGIFLVYYLLRHKQDKFVLRMLSML